MMYKFVRIGDASLIPKKLVEDNKDRSYPVERFYEYMKLILLDAQGNFSKTDFVNLIINKNNEVIGFLWYSLNILEGEIFINTISVDAEHRNQGEVLNWVFDTLKDAFSKTNYEFVKTISSRQGWHKNNGFEESKNVLLEFKLNKEGDGHG